MIRREEGFTMIELMMAMAIFSFMLLIIVSGFITVTRMHNQAIALNASQDTARWAVGQLEMAVQGSTGIVSPAETPGSTSHTLCLNESGGPQQYYYVGSLPSDSTAKVLYRADSTDNCVSHTNAQPLTPSSLQVADFTVKRVTGGTGVAIPSVRLTVSMASNNNTTTTDVATGVVSCNGNNIDRSFCSVATFSTLAAPR